MDLTPKSLSRALPWLAATLAVEGIVALVIFYKDKNFGFYMCMQAVFHVPQIALLFGFAGAVKLMTSGGTERIPCQRLQYGAFACIAATALARYVDVTVENDAPRGWMFFHAISSVLTAVAVPALWGCALAREEDLGSDRITWFGRLYARAAFFGMVSLLIAEVFAVAALGVRATIGGVTLGGALSSLILLPARAALLIAAWDAWRPAADELELRSRSQRSRITMPVAAAASMASSVVMGFSWFAESHGLGRYTDVTMLIWHGVVQLTLALMTAIIVSRALEAPELLHKPKNKGPAFVEPPPPPPPADLGPIDLP